jgi:hypothetical protein
VQGNSVHFEVFFTDEMRFEWIEVETDQAQHLMAVIVEFVFLIKRDSEEPTFKLPKWLRNNKSENRLTWKLIKNELFSPKKEPEEEEEPQEEEFLQRFDNLHDEVSSDDEGVASAIASSSRGKANYQLS